MRQQAKGTCRDRLALDAEWKQAKVRLAAEINQIIDASELFQTATSLLPEYGPAADFRVVDYRLSNLSIND